MTGTVAPVHLGLTTLITNYCDLGENKFWSGACSGHELSMDLIVSLSTSSNLYFSGQGR